MPKASAEADKLWPYLIKKVERVARSAGGSSGAAGIGGAPSPHALDSSHHTGLLTDYQAPQFLMRDGSRSLTGNLVVEAGITIDGVDLGAFKALYDVHVANPDAHHNRATAGDGLLISVQQLSVNEAFGFVWTAEHRFNADIQLDANLDFIGGDRVITASSDLTFTPADDLILTATKTWRSSDYADGITITGFSSHINAGGNRQLTINSIKADELHVRLFVADTVRVDVGEEYWGKAIGYKLRLFKD